jgi:hypothetical protein
MRGLKREARLRARDPRIYLSKRMDCRVKPGNDSIVDNSRARLGLTLADTVAISSPPGTSGHLAFDWE